MNKEGKIRCPVCDGSGRMTIVEFVGVEKKKLKVPCTACGGERWIPYLDLREEDQEVEAEAVSGLEAGEALNDIEDGWRKSNEWGKVHYFLDGRSICGNIRSKRAIKRSKKVVDVIEDDKCIFCKRKHKNLSVNGD